MIQLGFPQPFLPSQCRGRMKPRKLRNKPLSMTIKKACDSQYDPPGEATTFHLKHMVTQTRRIQSLLKRMKKPSPIMCLWDDAVTQLMQEWKAITRAKGFFQWISAVVYVMAGVELVSPALATHWLSSGFRATYVFFPLMHSAGKCEQSSKRFLKYKLQHLDKADNGANLAKQVKPFSASFDKLSIEQKTNIRLWYKIMVDS